MNFFFIWLIVSTIKIDFGKSSIFFKVKNKNFYSGQEMLSSWVSAKGECHKHNMELINVHSQKELQQLTDVLQMAGLHDKEHIWTSGTDLGSEGHFYWSSTAQDFSSAVPWFVLPDNKDNGEHCVELVNGTYLNDNICDESFHYLCYNIDANLDSEESYFEVVRNNVRNNARFFVFYEKTNSYLAEKACKKMKMNLASLKNFFLHVLKNVMIEANFTQIWVNYEKNSNELFIHERLGDILSKADVQRKCVTLKIDTESPRIDKNFEDCLSDQNFMCYKEEPKMYRLTSSTNGIGLNTLLIVGSIILLYFVNV